MAYKVTRWDNWMEFEGQRGLEGLSLMLTAEEERGFEVSHLVVNEEDVLIIVLHTRS